MTAKIKRVVKANGLTKVFLEMPKGQLDPTLFDIGRMGTVFQVLPVTDERDLAVVTLHDNDILIELKEGDEFSFSGQYNKR